MRCHPYLPFTISHFIESLYTKCPLLFWVICAVASPSSFRSQLEPHVKDMIRDLVLTPPGSVEAVQVLLIICMWPFPFSWHLHDPSFIYSGLAIQIGLQIGLHRPTLLSEFSLGKQQQHSDPDPNSDATETTSRITTWLACYVVNQIQASRRGVPIWFLEDHTLLSAFDAPLVPRTLSTLCHMSRLTAQSANCIGASAQNTSGLLDPLSRIPTIKLFSAQFASPECQHFPSPSTTPSNPIIELALLSSRLQLYLFAIHHDDAPISHDLLHIMRSAETDAMRLIALACSPQSGVNLPHAPFYVSRSICYSTLLLIRILKSPYATSPG